MGQLSPILRSLEDDQIGFWCPGCDKIHVVRVNSPERPCWGWNGSAERPTFAPSILVRGVRSLTDEQHAHYMATGELPDPVPLVCHTFVVDGQIQFLGDCTHALAGQTVPIPPLPDWLRDDPVSPPPAP